MPKFVPVNLQLIKDACEASRPTSTPAPSPRYSETSAVNAPDAALLKKMFSKRQPCESPVSVVAPPTFTRSAAVATPVWVALSQVAPPPIGIPLLVACRGVFAMPTIVTSHTAAGAQH